jgi:hypothetical protein
MGDPSEALVPLKNMTIDQYFQSCLADLQSKVELSPDEQKMLTLGQLEEFLFKRLTSKKFRRNQLTDKTLATIRQKVHLSVSQNKPIYLIFGFGGFKNSNLLQHHPHVGWGEVFNFFYITKLLAPILQVYQPGVIFEYESENEGAEYANNYTKQDSEAYNASFKSLIKFFAPFLPENLKFRYITLSDQYDTKAMFAEVDAKLSVEIAKIRQLPAAELEHAVTRALHNLKRNGARDLTKLSEPELKELAIESLAKCYTFLEEDYRYRENYFNGEERIMTIGSYCTPAENPDNWITINSTPYTANAFWTSAGILEKSGGTYKQIIVGPKRTSELSTQLKTYPVNVFSEVAPGLDKIEVLSQSINFNVAI